VTSAIMVEAYKKYVLVSLLHHGQLKPVPKHTPSIVQKHLKSLCQSYQDFANAYSTNNTDELHKVATQNAEVFNKVPLSNHSILSTNSCFSSHRTTISVWLSNASKISTVVTSSVTRKPS